jgi:DNA primase small subunit
MNPATTEFLRQRFTDYYRKAVLISPSSLEQREWGFVLFNPVSPDVRMRRHVGFSGRDELVQYIRNLIPRHLYYSTAYYERPDAATMADKGWCGADLIFDLDADHIFRGPYVHVKDIAFRGWGSAERRELIDYVCGIGIDPSAMLSGKALTAPGWQRRFRETLLEYFRWIGTLPDEEAIAHLTSIEGIGKDSAGTFLKKREEIIREIERHPTSMILKNRVVSALISPQYGEFKKRLLSRAALADEPVTTDTKRLIRMPTSLHGGSGMRVQPLDLRDLAAFDPLTDAVVFPVRDVRVEAKFPLKMPMLGSTYDVQKGISKVPEAVAVFLCCRDMAEIA